MQQQYRFEPLSEYLLNLDAVSDAMLLEELDGFLAGVLACPDLIPPSEWLPHVWNSAEGEGIKHEFKDLEDAQRGMGLVMAHYNEIARSLLPGSEPGYEPIISFSEKTGEEFCMFWLAGFERALNMRPESWMKLMMSGDEDAVDALARMRQFVDAASPHPDMKLEGPEWDARMDLLDEAPDAIAPIVETLALWRMAQSNVAPISAQQAFKNVGRNDPCPCGSGKKFKKCHGMEE